MDGLALAALFNVLIKRVADCDIVSKSENAEFDTMSGELKKDNFSEAAKCLFVHANDRVSTYLIRASRPIDKFDALIIGSTTMPFIEIVRKDKNFSLVRVANE